MARAYTKLLHVKITPEQDDRYTEKFGAYKARHPDATFAQWVRDALELQIAAEELDGEDRAKATARKLRNAKKR